MPKRVGPGREREKRKFSIRAVSTRHKLENSEKKKLDKKFQKLKNIILALFHAKTGRNRSRKREKNVFDTSGFYLTQTREFIKK